MGSLYLYVGTLKNFLPADHHFPEVQSIHMQNITTQIDTLERTRVAITERGVFDIDLDALEIGETPDPRWIADVFLSTVQLNEGRHTTTMIDGTRRVLPVTHGVFRTDMLDVRLRHPEDRTAPIEDQILSVVLNSNFRKGSLDLIRPHLDVFRAHIRHAIRRQLPVEIVLPTAPFKNGNPLSTPHEHGGTVDLGEFAHMAQVRDLCRSIEAIYQPGARFIILCDGIVYTDIFHTNGLIAAEGYRNGCENIRDALGLTNTVDIVDMSWLVACEPRFARVRTAISHAIIKLCITDPHIAQSMLSLRRGMLMNLPLREHTYREIASFVSMPEEALPPSVFAATQEAAVRYASFLLAMNYLRVIARAYPHAIRATVHRKPAPQLPFHLVNSHTTVFPYNGVPVVSARKWQTSGSVREALRIMRFSELLTLPNVHAVCVNGASDPFYYLVEDRD